MSVPLTSTAIIDLVQTAFADVELGDGITLHQAVALDKYRTDAEVIAARSQDPEDRWQEIPRANLFYFESALSFVDERGTRYYLPAFIIAALEGYISFNIPFFKISRMLGSLRKSVPSEVIRRYGFDRHQVSAIAAFLRFVVGEYGENAESQAELQIVWQWEEYSQELTGDI
ncbi:DUF6714 family protein [Chamaesiphon minutus]|uniref:Uncharacterized protein n=1 Tax=Chamaesiphon minutus (strain ATCC 27169 / PCC 6605) TaxID=1173020 RepID=K9UAM6_CHAP6|nr:DUF6714 family protein [Chamaesiphon minutus]AFY91683.1 hypothetical protein Cha6605_0386 [Chamaesiphon minutus PCC 6605]